LLPTRGAAVGVAAGAVGASASSAARTA